MFTYLWGSIIFRCNFAESASLNSWHNNMQFIPWIFQEYGNLAENNRNRYFSLFIFPQRAIL